MHCMDDKEWSVSTYGMPRRTKSARLEEHCHEKSILSPTRCGKALQVTGRLQLTSQKISKGL